MKSVFVFVFVFWERSEEWQGLVDGWAEKSGWRHRGFLAGDGSQLERGSSR